jgi:type II secretory pathway component PulJ
MMGINLQLLFRAAAPMWFAAPRAQQRGESLVGLMVGLSVGLIVLAAGSQMLTAHLQGHRSALQQNHLHHDLRSALDAIAGELRQAQGSGQPWQKRSNGVCSDAFCGADLVITGDRLVFSRDRNQNGMQDNNECTGFRLRNHELQIRTACLPEVWTDLTDSGSLQLTALNWQIHCEKRGPWVARRITVQITANWPHDPLRTLQPLTLTQTVSLRNEVPAQPWPAACGAAA